MKLTSIVFALVLAFVLLIPNATSAEPARCSNLGKYEKAFEVINGNDSLTGFQKVARVNKLRLKLRKVLKGCSMHSMSDKLKTKVRVSPKRCKTASKAYVKGIRKMTLSSVRLIKLAKRYGATTQLAIETEATDPVAAEQLHAQAEQQKKELDRAYKRFGADAANVNRRLQAIEYSTCPAGHVFDVTYKELARVYRAQGNMRS